MLETCSCRAQLGCVDLEQPLLKEVPVPSTHAEADVARVTINSAEMMLLRVKVTKARLPRRARDDYHEECWGAL